MLRFGFVRILGQLAVYDVAIEVRMGREVFVATLSEDPRFRFEAPTAEAAVARLIRYMADLSGRPVESLERLAASIGCQPGTA
jgi:hypothetical protein